MIIYKSDAIGFRQAVENNNITREIENAFISKMCKRPSYGEKSAWNNSMQFMEKIVRLSQVADDCGILIEFNIPSTSKRIDFIITGQDEDSNDNFIIIELKQWENAEATEKNDIVKAYIGKRIRETPHPSYQVWSYKQMLNDMNEAVYENNLIGYSCVYMHNYLEKNPEPLKENRYKEFTQEAPLFFIEDSKKLQDFVYKYVGKGKGMEILYRIENGRIKPSKKLIEHIDGLFKGNSEFVLLDEQKVAYETIISLAKMQKVKRTIIVRGGPGTGKSVISMNALGSLIKCGLNAKFIAPNASFRTVMLEQLTNKNPRSKGRIRSLFAGSGQFYDASENTFDVLIVDEAHRLKNENAYQYYGKNQIEDIIKAAKVSIFFIDDNQRIRPEDIGSTDEIKRIAAIYGSKVYELTLNAQFRCSGAEGFVNWIDDVLQIRETANFNGWDKEAFNFEVMDGPHDVYEKIKEKAKQGYKARMLAGYAWPWTSEKDGNRNGEVNDVCIPEHNFEMPWNGRAVSYTWAINEDGIKQIGCVHTSQGLEFDYVGVIVGNDLKFNADSMKLYADIDEYKDKPGKKGLSDKPGKLTELIKNIYKILFSRGIKGCYVYCRDSSLQKYIKERLLMIEQTNERVI